MLPVKSACLSATVAHLVLQVWLQPPTLPLMYLRQLSMNDLSSLACMVV